MAKYPRIGVGILIFSGNKVLMGKRKNAHGQGSWAPPGGHLEMNETPEQCAVREVFEETGLHVKNIRRGPVTNDIYKGENKHYVTLFMLADYAGGVPEVLESNKCETWQWFSWDDLPEPLFFSVQNLLRQINYAGKEVHKVVVSYENPEFF